MVRSASFRLCRRLHRKAPQGLGTGYRGSDPAGCVEIQQWSSLHKLAIVNDDDVIYRLSSYETFPARAGRGLRHVDTDARQAGPLRLAQKAEHAVDLETRASWAFTVQEPMPATRRPLSLACSDSPVNTIVNVRNMQYISDTQSRVVSEGTCEQMTPMADKIMKTGVCTLLWTLGLHAQGLLGAREP